MKKLIGICALMTIFLLFTGCGKTTNTISNMDTTTNKETIDMRECKKGCDMIAAGISKQDCYNICAAGKKLESNDINDCNDIEKTSGGIISKDICIQNKAIENKNPAFCKLIEVSISKDTCYISLANELKDKTLCKNINNEIMKTICEEENE